VPPRFSPKENMGMRISMSEWCRSREPIR
jgi:hypothetical protein